MCFNEDLVRTEIKNRPEKMWVVKNIILTTGRNLPSRTLCDVLSQPMIFWGINTGGPNQIKIVELVEQIFTKLSNYTLEQEKTIGQCSKGG